MALNTSLVLSALTTYTDQIGMPNILIQSIFDARTAKIVNKQTGVKGSISLNILTSQPQWTVASCGLLSSTGSVALSQQNITVNDIMGQEAICQVGPGSLDKYWTGVLSPKGTLQEKLTPEVFAKAFVADKLLKLQDYVEHLTWVGSTGTQSFSNLNGMTLANGFLYQLNFGSGAASVVGVTAAGGVNLTPTNCIAVVQNMIANLNQDIADKELVLFMSLANYQTLVNALLDKQALNPVFWVQNKDGAQGGIPWSFKWPYYFNLNIIATSGLQNRADLVLTYPENLYIGVDGEHDEEDFKIWYSADYNSIFYRTLFRLGTQFAFGQYIVYSPGVIN